MSAEERLRRLKKTWLLAVEIQKQISEELHLAAKQVAAIHDSIEESERRCQAMETWDGRQPDAWVGREQCWRAPQVTDIGKMVRVANQLGTNPSDLPEAKLVGYKSWSESGQRTKTYFCEGSKGQVVEWKVAWIETDGKEEIHPTPGSAYASIYVEGIQTKKPSKKRWKDISNRVMERLRESCADQAKQEVQESCADTVTVQCIGQDPVQVQLPRKAADEPEQRKPEPVAAWRLLKVYEVIEEGDWTNSPYNTLEPWPPGGGWIQVSEWQVGKTVRAARSGVPIMKFCRKVDPADQSPADEMLEVASAEIDRMEYREPNGSDFGAIVEVQRAAGEPWHSRILHAIAKDPDGSLVFVTVPENGPKEFLGSWKFARIRKDAVNAPADSDLKIEVKPAWRRLDPGETVMRGDFMMHKDLFETFEVDDDQKDMQWTKCLSTIGTKVETTSKFLFFRYESADHTPTMAQVRGSRKDA
jgi:hypothetical protein